jgi:hypothetical protein
MKNILLGTLALLLGAGSIANAEQQTTATPVDFAHQIVPILKQNCVTCHGGREAEGDFSLNTREEVLDSGMVELDQASASHLIELITTDDPDEQMPPSDRPRLSPEEVTLIRRWIDEGLNWDEGVTFAVNTYDPPLLPRAIELPPPHDGRTHPIDRLLDHYVAEKGLPIPSPITDEVFLRRVTLDLVGLLPAVETRERFLADSTPDRRERMIDELIADKVAYADHWMSFFNDLLRNDYSGTGFITGGRRQVSQWLHESLLANKPFDQMTRELVAPPSDESRGYIDGIKWRGTVSAGQTLPIQFSQSISQSFLGINMKCASCHDSFTDRWTLKQAYGLAAIYADGPLELHRCDLPMGEYQQAAWLFPELGEIDASAPRDTRLKQLADLMTHPNNGRYARTIVNRLWHRMMGRGLVHPLDAMQTQPWNEDLLDFLANELVRSGYDLKAVLRLIATSQAYQSASAVEEGQASEKDYVYGGPRPRRMTAEQYLDAVWQLTKTAPTKIQAPVLRHQASPEEITTTELTGSWIWGPNAMRSPAGEELLIRKVIEIPAGAIGGGMMVTCDNEFQLFINNRMVLAATEWTQPATLALRDHFKPGNNTLVFRVKNAGSSPNAAGLYCQGQVKFKDKSVVSFASDESWEFHTELPAIREDRMSAPGTGWKPVEVVPPVAPWTSMLASTGRQLLATAVTGAGEQPMVRASLLKNTPLMQSLGRPTRDQIVSMRPNHLTTLEAIDLANQAELSDAFARGASRLANQSWPSTKALIDHLFQAALSREPTESERELFLEALGDEIETTHLQDALWAICMLPEFMLVR